ncbi:MAG TPA: 5-oxoprolinase subunit PxpB [Rhodanobacteraceae bacterium]|nr:5-oxoprolinase subunit PxpB [Rhodanobacteraceae bacterium]
MDFTPERLAEDALLLRFGEGIDPATNARVHAAVRALRDADLPGVIDIAPAYASLLLRFDPFATEPGGSPESLHADLANRVRSILADAAATTLDPGLRRDDGRERTTVGTKAASHASDAQTCSRVADGEPWIVEVPVCYDGPDLDAVAAYAGLSRAEVIARHTAAAYTVAMLGFAPGFPYLLGLDPALHMPRREYPRTRVPAGSVAIGGAQTGIYPRELPGGWNLVGRTPLVLFDPLREPPCLLAPGDRVRFRAIGTDEFAHLAEHAA